MTAVHPRLDRVVIEITEHTAIENDAAALAAIKGARAREAFIAVDDAGSGYASLQHIMRLRLTPLTKPSPHDGVCAVVRTPLGQ